MKKEKSSNGKGTIRKTNTGAYECIFQSQYINPSTGKYKRFKRTGKTESEARKNAKMAMAAWEREFELGRDIKFDKTKTFGQYMEDYIELEAKPTLTGSGYHSYVRAMRTNFYDYPIANLQLNMLRVNDFQEYFDTILSKKARKTCAFPIQLCRRCCKWLVEKHLLIENYAAQTKLTREIADEYDRKKEEDNKNRKKVFTPNDIEKFYYAYKNNMGEYPVVVLVLLETGLRASEFASLRNSNVDIDARRINIVETRSFRFKDNDKDKGIEEYVKVPKNKEARFVMMSDLCIECVKYMQEQTKLKCKNNPEDLLYPTFRNGKRRSNSSMEVCFKDLCDKLDIDRDVHLTKTGQMKGLCLHALRHTADTMANTAKGANVVNTALMMGHKAISVENVYTHATEEALSSVVTPSQAVLDEYKRKKNEADNTDKEKELYEMYLKLKDKFEK